MARIRIDRADDHAPQAGGQDRVDARRRSAVRGAGLERHVHRRAAREGRRGERAQRFDFRVRQPRASMVPARHDAPAAHDHRADGGIRAGESHAERSLPKRGAHVLLVFLHAADSIPETEMFAYESLESARIGTVTSGAQLKPASHSIAVTCYNRGDSSDS
jgi:hypothetical protein